MSLKQQFKSMFGLGSIVWIAILLNLAMAAKKVPLPELQKKSVLDDSQLVKLAEQQKFVIPLSGRTISHLIQYMPKNQGECQFIEPTITYKSIAQSQIIFNNDDEITSILPLKIRQLVIVSDPYYNIASYSIDRHFLLKPKLPKTNLYTAKSASSIGSAPLANPTMVATSNEEYIYYLTTNVSFVFHYSNVASDIKKFKLEGDPTSIMKAIQKNGYVILCSGISGILVYKINQQTHELKLVQHMLPTSNNDSPVDMELNEQTQLLYVLNYERTIDVYLFDPKISEKSKDKEKQVLQLYDNINLQSITLNHDANSNPYEMIGNINIEISKNRVDQTIMILFSHQVSTVVAELSYKSTKKQYSFVRYFKYSVPIKEIHVIEDVMVVVGSGILGMFPYGIDPHIIQEEFNGFMTLTPIEKISITDAPFFVGISKNQMQFGGIFLNNQAGINCHLSSSSQLKQIKFKANLTVCGDLYPLDVSKYCEYEKTFIIKQMQLTASAPVAASLWIATIVFTLLIVVGLCCLFAIQKKKQRQIRKLQLYFEEKKRTELPASSDRYRTS